MTVYLLYLYDGKERVVLDVYATKTLAEAALREDEIDTRYRYSIREMEVITE